jgi:uncharacterized protein YjbI with pentapeptide repeats
MKSEYKKALQGQKELRGARLGRAKLAGVDLQHVQLQGADLILADLSAANLTGANLTSTNLDRTVFDLANLQGANLTSANISGTKFIGSNMRGVCLQSAYIGKSSGANFKDADLSGAKLSDVQFGGHLAFWLGANLRDADLSGAYIRRVREEFLPLSRQYRNILDTDVFWNALCERGITKNDFYENHLIPLEYFGGALLGNTRGPDGHIVSPIVSRPRLW